MSDALPPPPAEFDLEGLASVDDVVAEALVYWRPPPKLTISEWADREFYLSSESAATPGPWKTLPYQRAWLDAICDPYVTRISLMKSSRVGYALALDTPIPTPAGWSTMGALRPGDLVFDERGKPARVLVKSDVFADHECYRLRFCDGSTLVADAGHRWLVETHASLEHLVSGKRGRTGRPKPGETRTHVAVIDTKTIARVSASRGSVFAVPVAAPLSTRGADLPVPPYTLGFWLGDGNTASVRITQHRPDADEVARYITTEGIPATVRYLDKRYPNNATVLLDVPATGRQLSGAVSVFRAAGLLRGRVKHIPAAYLRASPEQRLELLRGLMDSDGTIGANGRAEFTNTNESLARGVFELVVSLGIKASFHYRPAQRVRCLPQWRVNFKPTPSTNPFKLRRKAAKVLEPAKPTITFRRRIVAVEAVPSVPVQCIEVDSPSRLFLAGDSMIPTHNTKCIDAAIAFGIAHDPCSMLVVQPTVDDAKGFSKEEIGPMLRDVPALAAIAVEEEKPEPGQRKGPEETILQKFFPGGVLSLVGANSGAGLRRISRKKVFCDEADAFPPSAGKDGDPVELAFRRAETYWDRKEVLGSTPLIEGTSRIARSFLEGDQRRFFVPCPHCGTFAIFCFKPDGGGHFLVFDKEKPEGAHFVCAANGCVIEHKDKRQMVERGQWRAARPFKGHASFHIWAAYSFSPNATWADIAKAFVKANNAGPEELKTFVNTWLGETWKELGEAPAWEHLFARRESYAGVPAGAVVLTCGVDVQKDRLVYEVVGWAPGRESWSVEIGVLPGDTALEETWLQLDELLERSWESARGPMVISKMAVDSGFNTQHVYSWVRLKDPRRVMAIKGVSKQIAALGSPSSVDVTYRGKRYARGCKVWPVGVDSLKSELYGFLRLFKGEGPTPNGYCHFNEANGEDYFKQLTGEHLVSLTNKRTKFTVYEWQLQPGRENHFLDCRVYARAAATSIGLDRMKAPKRDEASAGAAAGLVAQAVAVAPVAPPKPPPLAPKPPPKVKVSDSRFQFRRKYGSGWLKK